MEQVRLFIAIELPDAVKTGLKQVQGYLKSEDRSWAKWVDPDSIHLTLKFLGNVDTAKIEPISRSMQDAADMMSPFDLKISGLGCFPNFQRMQVIWVGLNGDMDSLQKLQNNIELHVSPLGFPGEKRPFKPHLTLCRIRENITSNQRQSTSEVMARTHVNPDLTIKVNSVSLMRSRLTPNGAMYTRISLAKLKPSC